jgi:predicted ester cyclase
MQQKECFMPTYQPTIQKLFDNMWNKQQLELVGELFLANPKIHYGDSIVDSLDDFRDMLIAFFEGFPNIIHKIDDYIETKDRIVTRWHGNGTQTGNYAEISASNKEFHYSGITIFALGADGKIAEAWTNSDITEQLQVLAQ